MLEQEVIAGRKRQQLEAEAALKVSYTSRCCKPGFFEIIV